MLSIQVVIFVAIYILWQIAPSVAYSWQLNAAPVQCADISITVTGTDGQPPYSVLVVPFGPTPFQNGIDVRGVVQKNFSGNSNSVNVPIKYPANTQFVAVVSDSAGFGTGGTSAATLVGESGDNSCFDSSQSWSPHFWFYIGPKSQPAAVVVQCSSTRIWWNHTADVKGTPSFVAVIPGGLSFPIPDESGITDTPDQDEGIGFSWLPRTREGTQLVIVGGDSRGLGAGGQGPFTIAHSDDSSCVTAGSPGITPGAVTGAVKSTRNMTAIIGGSVGGSVGFIALCAVALLYTHHLRNQGKYPKESAVYSINSDRRDIIMNKSSNTPNPLSHYDVEPFANQGPQFNGCGYGNTTAPMMQLNASSQNGTASMSGDHLSIRPQSVDATSSYSGPGAGLMTFPSSHSKTQISTNIIQHTDRGPGGPPAENVQAASSLPPTYDSLVSAHQVIAGQRSRGEK